MKYERKVCHCIGIHLLDEVHTDPGTDFKAKILDQFNRWYGITHMFSLISDIFSDSMGAIYHRINVFLSQLSLSAVCHRLYCR